MKVIVMFLVLLTIPMALAVDIEYDLRDSDVLVSISSENLGYFNIELPADFKNLELNTPDYFISDNYLVVQGNGGTLIKFSSSYYLEQSGKGKLFIAKNENHLGSNIKIILPAGNSLIEDKIIFPKNYLFSTDGKRIILSWDNMREEEILLSYSDNGNNNFIYYLLAALTFLFVTIYYYQKNKSNEAKTRNLFRDEKKIMNYLLKKKECWTKDIVKDLDISKVKLSRKLRTLEEKGLISKTPHGNENRIKLK